MGDSGEGRERVGDSGEGRERVRDSGGERDREWGIVRKKGREREWGIVGKERGKEWRIASGQERRYWKERGQVIHNRSSKGPLSYSYYWSVAIDLLPSSVRKLGSSPASRSLSIFL